MSLLLSKLLLIRCYNFNGRYPLYITAGAGGLPDDWPVLDVWKERLKSSWLEAFLTLNLEPDSALTGYWLYYFTTPDGRLLLYKPSGRGTDPRFELSILKTSPLSFVLAEVLALLYPV
jgi:hypothetical protein